VPSWVVLLVELLLDESSDILLDVELLQGLGGDILYAYYTIFGVLILAYINMGVLNECFICKSIYYLNKIGLIPESVCYTCTNAYIKKKENVGDIKSAQKLLQDSNSGQIV